MKMKLTIKEAMLLKKINLTDCKEVYTKYFLDFGSLFNFLKVNEGFSNGDIDYLDYESDISIEEGYSIYSYSISRITIEGEINL